MLTSHGGDCRRTHVDWHVEVAGVGRAGTIAAQIVVPSARRARITVKDWNLSDRFHIVTALRLLTGHLFESLDAHKVSLQGLDTGVGILSAALECGFVEEGRRRHTSVLDGFWRDTVHMGILEDESRPPPSPKQAEFVPSTNAAVEAGLPVIPVLAAADYAILHGERVTMRRRRPSDRETFYAWLSRSEWWRGWMPEDPEGFSPPDRVRFEIEWRGAARPNEWVVETERGLPIGLCFHSGLDRENRRAEADVIIYEADHWGRGYGTEAFALLLRHLFEDLHLHRVSSGTWSGNVSSLRVQAKSGLRIEARGREDYFIDGAWYDGIGTGILENEYTRQRR